MDNQTLILQCNGCKKLFRISQHKWESLIKRWGTANNAVENYLCKQCNVVLPTPPGVAKDNIFTEHASPEEVSALEQTIDGHRFNKDAVLAVLDNITLYKRIISRNKGTKKISPVIKAVSENDLKKFEQMYLNKVVDKEKQDNNETK